MADKLPPLGFHDHYLIQGLRDQVEELQEALQRAMEELNDLEIPVKMTSSFSGEHWLEECKTAAKAKEAIGIDLRISDARSQEMIRMLDQLQQKEVKL